MTRTVSATHAAGATLNRCTTCPADGSRGSHTQKDKEENDKQEKEKKGKKKETSVEKEEEDEEVLHAAATA
jgi:hypothetical protein